MTLRLFLVAHAATAATRAARFPADEPPDLPGSVGALRRIDVAACGPEARCRATAAALGLDASPDARLADLDVGAWRGLATDDVPPADLLAWLTDPAAAPHGGEPLTGVLARAADWLAALPATPARVAAVVAPALVRAAVLRVLAAPPTAFWALDVAPLTVTELSRGGGRWRVRAVGRPLAAGEAA
ncbi:histidine phosphatase family protein [Actinomadura atramentaria]|uniref:histidine phosphatase family protein n=1 Tax=Actinomadura atramentaria TaxID=1990 RepID=UPI00035E1E76|nr:histidine phosphatase family protein [Actinomadura atramentaria]